VIHLLSWSMGALAIFLLPGTFFGPASAYADEEPIAEIDGQKIFRADVQADYSAERPRALEMVRADDNAARTLAMDWYRARLFSLAAREEGFFASNPAIAAQADRIHQQYIAAEYLTWLLGTKYQPSKMELSQLYQLQPGLCASGGRVRLARLGVIWGRNASPEEVAAAGARFEAMQSRLAAGESFAVVADDASDFRTSGPGGDAGWIELKTLEGNPMGEQILALVPGERSEVISLPESKGLFEMLQLEGAGTLPLAACEGRLAEALSQKFRVDELAAKYDASLNVDAFIAAVRSIPAPGDPRVQQKLP
jgi:hypothetical protein